MFFTRKMFITKKKHEKIVEKHEKIVEKLKKEISDLKLNAIKEKEVNKSHFNILNKEMIWLRLELKKRPVYSCDDTRAMQKTIERQRQALKEIDYKIKSNKDYVRNTKWWCETCGKEKRDKENGMTQTTIKV